MTVALRDAIRASPAGVDPHGLLFERDGRLYRAFKASDAALFGRLLEEPSLEDLFRAGLVRFHRSTITVEGHDLVVEVDRVPVVSYPPEWPTVMLRDAGIMVARLGAELARHGLGLRDAHPWNVLFDGTRPIWIDLGSICEATEVSKGWIWEFRLHFIVPLALHRARLRRLADGVHGAHAGGLKAVVDRRWLRAWPPRYAFMMRRRTDPPRFFEGLATYVAEMPDRGASTAWSTYQQGRGAEVGEHDRYDGKQLAVDELLGRLPSGTLLDIGANAGWFSRLAVQHGQRVIAIDTDDPTLGALYLRAKRDGDPILPLRLDVMWPSGSYGLALAYAAAPDRLQSDTAMVLAVLHHLVGRQGISFAAFARTMHLFARHAVIVEFIPRDDEHVSKWPLAGRPWYEPEVFIEAMSAYFEHVATLPSAPAPRLLMLFKRPTGHAA